MFNTIIRAIGMLLVVLILTPILIAQNSNNFVDHIVVINNQMPSVESDAYTQLNQKIELDLLNVSVEEALNVIAKKAKFKLMYGKAFLPEDKQINFQNNSITVFDALLNILDGTDLKFAISPNQQLVLLRMREDEKVIDVENEIQVKMREDEKVIEVENEIEIQERVSGRVTDAQTGEPLVGATIIIEGTNTGTTTDINGNFQITVPTGNETLIVSFIGFERQRVPLEGRTEIDIQLRAGVLLEELVVTGYGVQRKDELTGAISIVNIEDIETVPTHNPLKVLQGRVPGLHITRNGTPGAGMGNVLIRGMNTLGDNTPLYIIDGQPVPESSFNLLDANDIASIQVLKDAASASIYGSRASNGVIIITTKNARPGQLIIAFNSSLTGETFYNHKPMLNTEERGAVLWQAAINDGVDPNNIPQYSYEWHHDATGNPVLEKVHVVEWLDQNVQGGIRSGDTDWLNAIKRPGYLTRTNLSLSSGSEVHRLMISVGHLYNQGTIKYTDYERKTVRINSNINLLDGRLTIGENLQVARGKRTPEASGIGGSTLSVAQRGLSIMPIYAEDGSFAGPIGAGFSDRMNPLLTAELGRDWEDNTTSALGSLYLQFNVLENLVYSSNFGINYSLDENIRIFPRYMSGFLTRHINSLEHSKSKTEEWTWFNTLNYMFNYGEHSTNILAGIEATKSESELLVASREDFLLESKEYMYIDAGTGIANISGSGDGYRLLSYFTKWNYNYANRYYATATLRYDGSSRFGSNERFGFFPAFSLGWRISSEDFFMNNVDFFSQLMLRFGMGKTGNQLISNSASRALFIPGYGLTTDGGRRNIGSAYDLNGAGSGTLPSGVIATQTANDNLRWEATDEINIGIDFGLFQQRLTGSIDYFWRETTDILIRPPVLAVVGEGGPRWENGATMDNKGWEVSLGYEDRSGDFGYSFITSVGSFEDKVTYLPQSVVGAYPGNIEQTILGRPRSSIFGFVVDGIFQNQAEVDAHSAQTGKGIGRIRFKDLNGDGVINELDQTWLGTGIPDFEYGLHGRVNYRNYRISFFLFGVQGITVNNSTRNRDIVGFSSGENWTKRALNGWTPQSPNTSIPAASLTDTNNEVRISTYQNVNASYLKMRDIQLGYVLPPTMLQSLGINHAEIYISGTELFTIKSKSFDDPDPENPGTSYPIPRTFTVGVSLIF